MASFLDTLKIIAGRRWPLIVALFAIEVTLIVVVSNSAFFPKELTTYERQYNTTATVLNESAIAQVGGIFSNNLRVAGIELLPLLGLFIFGLSLYETARIVEVIGVVKGVSVGLALANLFFLPSTWLELPAYAIASAESIYLCYAIYRGFRYGAAAFVREIRFLIVNVILIAGVLIVAATFEVTEIQIELGPVQTQIYALLTWLPFAVVFAAVLVFWRKARKDAPAIVAREAAEAAQNDGGYQGEKDEAGSPAPSPWRDEGGATA